MLFYSVYAKIVASFQLPKENASMKRFLIAIALTCLLSVSALAGEIPTVGNAPAAPGEIPTVGAATTIVLTIISLLPR
jgi:hypothetical protein